MRIVGLAFLLVLTWLGGGFGGFASVALACDSGSDSAPLAKPKPKDKSKS